MFHINQRHKKALALVLGESACLCLLAVVQTANANPVGGSVTSGKANIVSQGSITTITQTSNTAIINWQDFSINAGQTTQFIQPSSSAVALNRVTGPNISQINGHLIANGNIYILNPNGIIFGKGSSVNVGSLFATTSHISDQAFLQGLSTGKMQFSPSKNTKASIINNGLISIKKAGLAVMVAPTVINNGVIQATLGKVAIGASDHFTLDLYGDNLITLDAGTTASNVQLINQGLISADGGSVLLTAQAADQALQSVVNISGYIQAKTVSTHQGKVLLQGSANTILDISGVVDVSGKIQDQLGGLIQVTADYVKLEGSSLLDASGSAGGGTIHIGSDVFHTPGSNLMINTLGLPATLPTANYVYAAPDSRINVNALSSGDGGTVVVYADQATWYYGNIDAEALGSKGHGGRVETSGHYLDINGAMVNTSSASGRDGLWLLDPFSVTVTSGASTNGSFVGTNPYTWTPTAASNVLASSIGTELGLGNVVISTGAGGGADNITFSSGNISWSGTNSLTFLADGSITINGGTITTAAGQNVFLRPDSQALGAGTVTVSSGGIFGTGNVSVYNNGAFTSANTTYVNIIAPYTSYWLVQNSTAGEQLSDISSGNPTEMANNYALATNISSNLNTAPIGSSITAYSGIFTGSTAYTGVLNSSPYSVTGLTITGAVNGADTGMFGQLTGTVDNITLNTPVVTDGGGTSSNTGDLVGLLAGGTLSGNISILGGSGTMLTNSGLNGEAGALIGQMSSGSIAAGSVITVNAGTGTILSNSNAAALNDGGVIGLFSGGTISGTLGATGSAGSTLVNQGTGGSGGGVIGGMTGGTIGATATLSANTGNVTGGSEMGGVIGSVTGGTFDAGAQISTVSGSPGTVTGTDNTGGVFGAMSGVTWGITSTIINDYNVATTGNNTGGIFGSVSNDTAISTTFSNNFTNNGAITNTGNNKNNFGGIAGFLSTDISGSASISFTSTGTLNNTGTVAGNGGNSKSVGGIFGSIFDNTGTITLAGTMTNSGSISGGGGVGGIIGDMRNGGILASTAILTTTQSGSNSISAVVHEVGGLIGDISVSPDPNTHTWSNAETVTCLLATSYIGGIFGNVTSNIIDVPLLNTGNVSCPTGNVGGITGLLISVNITFPANLTNTGNIVGDISVGGLFGQINDGTLGPASGLAIYTNSGSVTGNGNVGGLVGRFFSGTITANAQLTTTQVSTNIISGTGPNVGGLIGELEVSTDPNSHTWTNAESVTGTTNVGGIVGFVSSSTLTGPVTNAGTVTGMTDTGGDFGYMSGSSAITAWLTGTVNGQSNTGGITGYMDAGSSLDQVANTSSHTVVGITDTGGIVGQALSSSISNALFTGVITNTGGSSVGGIIGNNNSSSLTNTLSIGYINSSGGTTHIGAVAGTNSGTFTSALYDTRYVATGVGSGSSAGTVGSASNAFFGSLSTYTGAGFNMTTIWNLTPGNYANLDFCGAACTVALPAEIPSNTIPNNLLNAINQTQSILVDPYAGILLIYVTPDVVVLPGSSLLTQLNLGDNTPDTAAWFISNTYVLQGFDTNNVDLTTPQNSIGYMINAIDLTVQALQGASACGAGGTANKNPAAGNNAVDQIINGVGGAGVSSAAIGSVDLSGVSPNMSAQGIQNVTNSLIDYFMKQDQCNNQKDIKSKDSKPCLSPKALPPKIEHN